MIDLNNVGKYHENNRLEAKKALGGLPHSIWETYSAFANTLGGIILLGVEEYRDKSLHPVDLPSPEQMVKTFWEGVNDPKTASVNIPSPKDVQIENVSGCHIIVINVPRADRSCRPVYIYGNPLNSYRRNGEGDYRCTPEEFLSMVRDASVPSQDLTVLEEMNISNFNPESVQEYRRRMKVTRPGHEWETLDDEAFLTRIGAAGAGEDGRIHATCGGLLMFGNEYDIVRVFPQYFLDYREEHHGSNSEWTERIVSSSGGWSGNVLDFYFRVCSRILRDMKTPVEIKKGMRPDDIPVLTALREALANCIVNADYYGRGGLVIIKEASAIRFSNPGTFRIDINTAKSGGFSDPRNGTILKMLNLIDIGKRAGSGIPGIFKVWRDQNWQEPEILQSANPDRTTLYLSFLSADPGKSAVKTRDKDKSTTKMVKRQMIIDYLTDHVRANSHELSEYLNLKPSRMRDYINELIRDGIVIPEGGRRNRTYKLKA